MSHADVQTTIKDLHYAPRDEDAALIDDPTVRCRQAGSVFKRCGV